MNLRFTFMKLRFFGYLLKFFWILGNPKMTADIVVFTEIKSKKKTGKEEIKNGVPKHQ